MPIIMIWFNYLSFLLKDLESYCVCYTFHVHVSAAWVCHRQWIRCIADIISQAIQPTNIVTRPLLVYCHGNIAINSQCVIWPMDICIINVKWYGLKYKHQTRKKGHHSFKKQTWFDMQASYDNQHNVQEQTWMHICMHSLWGKLTVYMNNKQGTTWSCGLRDKIIIISCMLLQN